MPRETLARRPACKACHRELGINPRHFAREFVKQLMESVKVVGDVYLRTDQIYVMNPEMVTELLKQCKRHGITYKAFEIGGGVVPRILGTIGELVGVDPVRIEEKG
jgi:translation elongation factor EF-Ts